jgi:hypothetical protein
MEVQLTFRYPKKLSKLWIVSVYSMISLNCGPFGLFTSIDDPYEFYYHPIKGDEFIHFGDMSITFHSIETGEPQRTHPFVKSSQYGFSFHEEADEFYGVFTPGRLDSRWDTVALCGEIQDYNLTITSPTAPTRLFESDYACS